MTYNCKPIEKEGLVNLKFCNQCYYKVTMMNHVWKILCSTNLALIYATSKNPIIQEPQTNKKDDLSRIKRYFFKSTSFSHSVRIFFIPTLT